MISIGDRFGRLVSLDVGQMNSTHHVIVKCACDCGVEKDFYYSNLKSGKSTSCGCRTKENSVIAHLKHGNAKKNSTTPEFTAWVALRGRCKNPRNPCFHHYGGRGISVCERWDSFELFLSDMGNRPSPKHSVDRIDVNGDYKPENCRWATQKEQVRNTRRNKLSEEVALRIRELISTGMSKAEIGRRLGVNYSSVKQVCYGKQWV